MERNLNLHIFFSNAPQFWQDLGSIYCLHGVEPSRDMEMQKTAFKVWMPKALLLNRFDGRDCIHFKNQNGPKITRELVQKKKIVAVFPKQHS